MPILQLDENFYPGEDWVWQPLELTDINQQVYGDSGSVYEEAIKAGEREYKEASDAYEKSFQPTEDTPENREAIAHLKRLMGRR